MKYICIKDYHFKNRDGTNSVKLFKKGEEYIISHKFYEPSSAEYYTVQYNKNSISQPTVLPDINEEEFKEHFISESDLRDEKLKEVLS